MASDPSYLDKQYATSGNLSARRSIYRFAVHPREIYEWALALLGGAGPRRVLDAGCGDGGYLRRLPGVGVGFDRSPGMAREASAFGPVLVADAQSIPFAADSFDAVLAMHMLYHVPDIPLALREIRRVLRPGGALLALTNSGDHLAEMRDTFGALSGASMERSADRFKLENGEPLLREAFDEIELHPFQGQLRVTDTEAVLEYIDSVRGAWEPQLASGRSWESCRAALGKLVEERIASDGAFEISTHAGVFVCR